MAMNDIPATSQTENTSVPLSGDTTLTVSPQATSTTDTTPVALAPSSDAPLTTNPDTTVNQTVPNASQPPVTAYPPSAYVSNDGGLAGVTTVTSPPVPTVVPSTPIVVNADTQIQHTSENIPANGGSVFPLQNTPDRINSVVVNGQPYTIAVQNVQNPVSPTPNQALYDIEQNALIFAQDIHGLIEVGLSIAPKIEHEALAAFVSFLHERVLALEGFISRLRGSNYV